MEDLKNVGPGVRGAADVEQGESGGKQGKEEGEKEKWQSQSFRESEQIDQLLPHHTVEL